MFQIKDGRIIRMERYHDDQRVDAFIRLTQERAATNQVAIPPVLQRAIGRERADWDRSIHLWRTIMAR